MFLVDNRLGPGTIIRAALRVMLLLNILVTGTSSAIALAEVSSKPASDPKLDGLWEVKELVWNRNVTHMGARRVVLEIHSGHLQLLMCPSWDLKPDMLWFGEDCQTMLVLECRESLVFRTEGDRLIYKAQKHIGSCSGENGGHPWSPLCGKALVDNFPFIGADLSRYSFKHRRLILESEDPGRTPLGAGVASAKITLERLRRPIQREHCKSRLRPTTNGASDSGDPNVAPY